MASSTGVRCGGLAAFGLPSLRFHAASLMRCDIALVPAVSVILQMVLASLSRFQAPWTCLRTRWHLETGSTGLNHPRHARWRAPCNAHVHGGDGGGLLSRPDLFQSIAERGSCKFTPVVASRDYTIVIKVGRGGAAFQDLIGGYDEDPTDSKHAFLGYYADVFQPNQNPFSLIVAPGSTDAQVAP